MFDDARKTKAELLKELHAIRQRVMALEALAAAQQHSKQAGQTNQER